MTSQLQLENGYTRIANEILEQIAKLQLNGTQFRILLIIWRNTYGYGRKSHEFSESYLAKALEVHKMQIQRELKTLISLGIIEVEKDATFNTSRRLRFNKECCTKQLANPLSVNEIGNHTVSESVTSTVSESATQKRKKKNSKDIITNAENDFEAMFESAWKLYPCKKGKSAVKRASKETLYYMGIEKITLAIEVYKRDLAANPWKQPMHGNTFFSGRYEDYLPVDSTKPNEKGKLVELSDEEIERHANDYFQLHRSTTSKEGQVVLIE